MTTTIQAPPTQKARMTSTRKHSLAAGIFYVVTFISIPILVLYNLAKTDHNFILGGNGTPVVWGTLTELTVALAGIGTAVALFPIVKRQNESLAIGFVATRTLEAALIFVGVVSLLSLVTLQQDFGAAPGADSSALVITGASHAATYQWAFTVGQSLMPGINAILLGTLMYRSRLVPRWLPTMGLIGAPLLITSTLATVVGLNTPLSAWSALSALPVAAWELTLGIYLITKGFKRTPLIEALDAEEASRIASGRTF